MYQFNTEDKELYVEEQLFVQWMSIQILEINKTEILSKKGQADF